MRSNSAVIAPIRSATRPVTKPDCRPCSQLLTRQLVTPNVTRTHRVVANLMERRRVDVRTCPKQQPTVIGPGKMVRAPEVRDPSQHSISKRSGWRFHIPYRKRITRTPVSTRFPKTNQAFTRGDSRPVLAGTSLETIASSVQSATWGLRPLSRFTFIPVNNSTVVHHLRPRSEDS